MAGNNAKYTKEHWERVRVDFDTGNYKTISELACRHGMTRKDLDNRMYNERWNDKREIKYKEVLGNVSKIKEDLASAYLKRAAKRFERYEKLIDVSQEQLGSRDAKGNPVLDPDSIGTYTMAEARVHEMMKSALRIPDVKNLDITSKGQSIGESIAGAIEKLRNDPNRPVHSLEDEQMLIEAEIVEDEPEA